MPRLEAIKGELEVDDLVTLAKDHFVEWVSDAMYDAAREGVILVEIRFGAEWMKWPDLMPGFREAERQVQSTYPDFCAEVIASGVRTAQPDVVDACMEAREAGLAGIDLLPAPYEREADPAEWKRLYSWAEWAAGVGLGITVHVGEFSPANIRSALRVPGVYPLGDTPSHAAFDTALLDQLGEGRAFTVECCLTSNVVLGAVSVTGGPPDKNFSSMPAYP